MPHRSRKLPGKLISRYDRAPDLDMPGAAGDGPYKPGDGALSVAPLVAACYPQ
jgi:hypothetical protein